MLFQNANPLFQCIAKTPINKFYLNFIYLYIYIYIKDLRLMTLVYDN